MNKFCERLRKLRKANKLTQKQLGDKLGLSDSIITMYEKGIRQPSVKILGEISDIFGVSMDYLTGKTDDPKVQILQTNFFDNEGKKHDIEIEYQKDSKDDMISLEEIEILINTAKKLGIDLSKMSFKK